MNEREIGLLIRKLIKICRNFINERSKLRVRYASRFHLFQHFCGWAGELKGGRENGVRLERGRERGRGRERMVFDWKKRERGENSLEECKAHSFL